MCVCICVCVCVCVQMKAQRKLHSNYTYFPVLSFPGGNKFG